MALSSHDLRVELQRAGIATSAVDAVWPQWWSSEADGSLSATAELTFTVARRLGLSPQTLLDGEARFVWRDETKFKRLTAAASKEEQALSSFGCAVARSVIAGTPGPATTTAFDAATVRAAILSDRLFVDALALLSFAWGIGIPVIQLRVFPLSQKRMHAMSAAAGGRAAVLLARDSSYLAPMAFTLAHELGHIMLGHLDGATAVIDVDDPLTSPDLNDNEEVAADRFALELLTGDPEPQVLTDADRFSATELAGAVERAGPRLRIDPAMLALCAGHNNAQWEKVFGALKILAPGQVDVPGRVNDVARQQLAWSTMADDSQDYLRVIMGLADNDV